MFRAQLVFFIVILFFVQNSTAQMVNKDTVSMNYIDLNYFDEVDTDARSFVIIDSSILSNTDTFRKIVLKRYSNNLYNFADSTLKLDTRKFVNRNAIKLRKNADQWPILAFLTIVLLFVIIKNVYSKTLSTILQAYWNDRAISQFTRDDNFFKLRNAALYFLLFSMVYGLLLTYILNNYGIKLKDDNFEEFIFITLSAMAFYALKFILMKFFGYVFSIQKVMSGYLSIISISNFIYAISIIPLLIIYNYIPSFYEAWVFYIMLVLFCFNTIYKYVRTASFIVNNFQFPKFYLFLYLCSLEMIPLLIIYKVFLA